MPVSTDAGAPKLYVFTLVGMAGRLGAFMVAFEGGPAAAPLFVDVEGFMGQGVHHLPGDVGVAGGVGARGAVGDLATGGGAAFDGQEGGGDVVPAGVPLDAAGLDGVLGFEHQRVFGFEAVVDRRGTREEVAYQVEHAVTDTGDVDADVLHVEALAQFFDLAGLVGERRGKGSIPILKRCWGSESMDR